MIGSGSAAGPELVSSKPAAKRVSFAQDESPGRVGGASRSRSRSPDAERTQVFAATANRPVELTAAAAAAAAAGDSAALQATLAAARGFARNLQEQASALLRAVECFECDHEDEPRFWPSVADNIGQRSWAGFKISVLGAPAQYDNDDVKRWLRTKSCPHPCHIESLASPLGCRQLCLTFDSARQAETAKAALRGDSLELGAQLTQTTWWQPPPDV